MKKVWLGAALVILVLAVGVATAEDKPAAGYTIARMVICSSVENHEPVGETSSFPASVEKVYCYLELTNIAKETSVSFVWKHNGQEKFKFTQNVPALSKFRTWAHKNPHGKTGEWTVEILDAGGAVVKSAGFKVE